MRVLFTRLDPLRHELVVQRPGRPALRTVLETRSMLVHDLCHYAVEAELGIEHGFYGLLAGGQDLETLREPGGLDEATAARLLEVERQVVRLQSAFRRASVGPEGAAERLRSVMGAWKKARQGQALALSWPAGPPVLVPAP